MSRSTRSPLLPRLQAQQNDAQRKILFTGGHVVTMDDALGELAADVLVIGDRIEQVAPGLGDSVGADTTVVDVAGCVIMPGFVDSHVHAWEGALRGIAPDADFGNYMAITHGGIAAFMSPADVAIGQRVTAAQALNGGVTTFVDNSHNSRSPEHSDAAIEALRDAGIRAVHAVGSPTAGEAGTHLPADLLRLRDQYFASADQRLTLRMFDITPSPQSWQFASDNGLDIVAEMGMWVPDLDALFGTGLMGPGHTYNHCSGLSPDHWAAIADSGAAINMVPRSDSHFGLGAFVPVLEANRRGIQEGISCDNELSYGYDMFTEMRVLQTVQRGLSFQAEWSGEVDAPARYGARDVLRAATVGGSLNAGLADRIGSITPGKKADLVVLDLDQVPTRLHGSVAGTVVNFAGVANVEAVFVDGIVRKWAGELVDVDHGALVGEAESSRDRLLQAYGTSLEAVRAGTNIHIEQSDAAVSAIVSSSGH
jgi:cytosine/adenosine deaminase-related metal-dependent hydrolase